MAVKNIVPNLEAKASDGNPIFTPRQWLERVRQFTTREHKIDITLLVKGEDITETGWTEKEATIQEDFFWGVGSGELYQITWAEYKTEPDSINQRLNPVIYRTLPSKTKYIPQQRRFLLGKTIGKWNTGRIQETIKWNWKGMQLQYHLSRKLLISSIWPRLPTRNYGTN